MALLAEVNSGYIMTGQEVTYSAVCLDSFVNSSRTKLAAPNAAKSHRCKRSDCNRQAIAHNRWTLDA